MKKTTICRVPWWLYRILDSLGLADFPDSYQHWDFVRQGVPYDDGYGHTIYPCFYEMYGGIDKMEFHHCIQRYTDKNVVCGLFVNEE